MELNTSKGWWTSTQTVFASPVAAATDDLFLLKISCTCGLVISLFVFSFALSCLNFCKPSPVRRSQKKSAVQTKSRCNKRIELLPDKSDSNESQLNGYLRNKERREMLIRDSRMYESVLQGTRDIATRPQHHCNCQVPVRRCRAHNYCTECCKKNGWCRFRIEDISRGTIVNREHYLDEDFSVYDTPEETELYVDCRKRNLDNLPDDLTQILSNVVDIDLSFNRFKCLPDSMHMQKLKSCNLRFNFLSTLPSPFATNLHTLDLSTNSFSTFPSEVLGLTKLVNLHFGHNQMTSVPREISVLCRLKELGLEYNLLSELPASLFSIVTLQILKLCGNPLTTIPTEVCQALSLEHLDLSGCCLRIIPPSIGLCPSLSVLRLARNLLKNIPCELALLYRMTVLDITDNLLTSLPSALRFCTQISIEGNCQAISQDLSFDKWAMTEVVPKFTEVKNPQSLLQLAKFTIKEHGIRIDQLPFLLQEEFMELHDCVLCGHRGMPQYVRIIKMEMFGNRPLPFSYMVCQDHVVNTERLDLWMLHLEFLLSQ